MTSRLVKRKWLAQLIEQTFYFICLCNNDFLIQNLRIYVLNLQHIQKENVKYFARIHTDWVK